LRSASLSRTILHPFERVPDGHGEGEDTAMAEKLITDIGGEPAGPVPIEDRGQLFWEKQMIATFNVLQARKIVATDEFRRTVEEMPADYYRNSTFYGRRLDGMVRLLIEKGVIDEAAFEARVRAILDAGTRDHV
jgi:hypothetical protein